MTGIYGILAYLFVKAGLGGGAAFLTGRAVARTWAPLWQLAVYVMLLAAAVLLFEATVAGQTLSFDVVLKNILFLAAASFLGYRATRTSQMTTQYPWAFERTGPFSWRSRPSP